MATQVLWDIPVGYKKLTDSLAWGAQQLRHAQGFSPVPLLISLCVQAQRQTQAQWGWDIPAANASESSNTRHVWRGESTGFSITGKEGLPGPSPPPAPSALPWWWGSISTDVLHFHRPRFEAQSKGNPGMNLPCTTCRGQHSCPQNKEREL